MNEAHSGGLIKGRTAFELLKLRYKCTTVALAGLGVVLLLSRSGIPQSWFTNVLVLAMIIPTIPVALLIVWVPIRIEAEQEAGYTTLWNGLKELEQRDPYLGRVIRKPGGSTCSGTTFSGSFGPPRRKRKDCHSRPIPPAHHQAGLNDDGKQYPAWMCSHLRNSLL